MPATLHTDPLIARNPATSAELCRTKITPLANVAAAVEQARQAQPSWSNTPLRDRLATLDTWYRALAANSQQWADSLVQEIGKPRVEAVAEVLSTLDQVRYVLKTARAALADERLPRGRQRFMLVPPAWQRWLPFGVIGVIGTWNYPLYLNAPAIAAALAAGNAVVWKPSELASMCGFQLQSSFNNSPLPEHLVQAVHGGPDVGAALISSPLDKAQFTGGIPAGRSILTQLSQRGIPALAELSGFDPAIVRPDAPLDSTARALAWSSFIGAGQTCVAVKRVYIVGDTEPWAQALAQHAQSLRLGDPSTSDDVDMGPLINPAARDRFHAYIQEAVQAGAKILAGGVPADSLGPSFYPPTVLLSGSDNPAPEAALAGCFGPVMLIRSVPTDQAAIEAANASPFALAASVWGRNRKSARALATQIQAGMVAVNDAVAPLAHAAAPFGGMKASGYGRIHGILGLREYAQPQVLHVRRAGGYRPQLYPYSARTTRVLQFALKLLHR